MAACLALFSAFIFFSISLCQIFGFLGLLLGLVLVAIDRKWRDLRFPLGWPILIFSVWCVVAIFLSYDTQASLPFIKRLLEPVVFFWVVNAVPFLAANLEKNDLGGPELREIFLEESTGRIGLWILVIIGAACVGAAGYQVYQAVELKAYRPYGTLNNPITLGTMFMLVSLFLSAYLLFGEGNRLWVLVVLPPVLTGLIYSQTRSAWVGLVVGLAFLLWKKGWKWLMVLPVMIAVLYASLPANYKARINTIATASDTSAKERLGLWRTGLELVQDQPVKGFGFNTMNQVRNDYPKFKTILAYYHHFHNQYIQFAVDAGIPAVLAWLAIWLVFLANLLRKMAQFETGHPEYWFIMAGGSAVLAFLVTCVFENQYFDTEFTTLLFTLMAFPYFLRDKGPAPGAAGVSWKAGRNSPGPA